MTKRAIICPTNHDVDYIKNIMIEKMPGESFSYLSFDKLLTEQQSYSFPTEYLNSISISGVPPHILKLKVGAQLMLTRNLDPIRGHVNGTCYIIKGLHPRVIHAQIAMGEEHNVVFGQGQKVNRATSTLSTPSICLLRHIEGEVSVLLALLTLGPCPKTTLCSSPIQLAFFRRAKISSFM